MKHGKHGKSALPKGKGREKYEGAKFIRPIRNKPIPKRHKI